MDRPAPWQSAHETDVLELISGDGCLEAARAPLKPDAVEQLVVEMRQADPNTDWTEKLEQRISELTGFPHTVAVSSGDAGLGQALFAAGVRPGDEVIVPSYAPVSIADVVVSLEAVPVLIDIDEQTLLLTAEAVNDAVSDRTRAVIAVHVGGLAVPIEPLAQVAACHGLILIEETNGPGPGILCRSRTQRADIVCFRFDAISHFPMNRGGAVCTTDPEVAGRLRLQRLPAPPLSDVPLLVRGQGISQLAAAWEYMRLASVKERWRRRCQIAMTWSAGFGGSFEFQVPTEIPGQPHCWNQYMLRLNLQRCSISRVELVEQLRQRGVRVGIHYLPIHMHQRFQNHMGYGADTFPVARNEFLRELTLPINSDMSDSEVDLVWTSLMAILKA